MCQETGECRRGRTEGGEDEGSRIGHIESLMNDNYLLVEHTKCERRLLERGFEKGKITKAVMFLGTLLTDGANGVAAGVASGERLYYRAISNFGDVNAMANLGRLLVKG